MKIAFRILFFLCFMASPSLAAEVGAESLWQAPFPHLDIPMTAEGEVLSAPQCFRLINRAPYMVMGALYTNYYVDDKRQRARHTSNFRLEPGQSQPYCSYGPFYPGRKLDLVIRSFVPVFSCRTKIDADIEIMGEMKPGGGSKTWAVCREE